MGTPKSQILTFMRACCQCPMWGIFTMRKYTYSCSIQVSAMMITLRRKTKILKKHFGKTFFRRILIHSSTLIQDFYGQEVDDTGNAVSVNMQKNLYPNPKNRFLTEKR